MGQTDQNKRIGIKVKRTNNSGGAKTNVSASHIKSLMGCLLAAAEPLASLDFSVDKL